MLRRFLAALAAAALALGANAQDYPRQAITVVIPLAPGDATDIAGRAMGEELSRLMKVPVIAVNRPGAGGSIAADSVAKAPKDGYTVLFSVNSALTFRRVLEPQGVPYDPMKDLTALGFATRTPSVLAVRPDAPYRSFREMVEYAKKNPGKVRVGTAGPGSVGDFCVQIMNSQTGAGFTMVPFKGAAPAVAALRGGHIEGVVLALGALAAHFKNDVLKPALISSKFPALPDIPTLAELGYRQNLLGVWIAFFAPAGIPAEVASALVSAIEKTVKNPEIAARLIPLGIMPEYLPPGQVQAEMRDEQRRVEEIARRSGLLK
ncbi:MAG: tripartite tricarboxylate transporter substrate binding protein [Betaproteobacteria bacterium]|nr:tripartite tricarboxylate transporter substrate binding protein [Betaproteobacteria bacterium]